MVPKTTDLTGGKWYTPIGSKGTDSGCSLPWKALQAIHMKMEVAPPSWSDRLKSVGLVFGTVACGALALGLLPLTIIGGVVHLVGKRLRDSPSVDYDATDKKISGSPLKKRAMGERLEKIGFMIAPPLAGCHACIKELRRDPRSLGERELMRLVRDAITSPVPFGNSEELKEWCARRLTQDVTTEEWKKVYNAAVELKLSEKTVTGQIAAGVILDWLKERIDQQQRKEAIPENAGNTKRGSEGTHTHTMHRADTTDKVEDTSLVGLFDKELGPSTTVDHRLITLNTIKTLNINDPEGLRRVPLIQQLTQEPPTKGSYQLFFKTLTGKSFTVMLTPRMNILQIKSLLLPHAQKDMSGREDRQIASNADLRIIIGGKELGDDEILDDYKPTTLATIHLVYRLGNVEDAFSCIASESLQNRVLESVAYITNFDDRLQRGLYDQEIHISEVEKHIQTIKEAQNVVPKRYKSRFQSYLNCAQRVLEIAPMVNRLVHLSGGQYDGIQSKLTGAALEELELYNKKNPTFIQRLTNELRRIYKVGDKETIQGYSMRVESALHMLSKALDILQESSETDREVKQFFLDSIDRVWDSYLTFLYKQMGPPHLKKN